MARAACSPCANRVLKALAWVSLSLLAVVVTVVLAAWAGRPKELAITTAITQRGGQHDLDIARIRATVERLASLGSRMSGYAGAEQAAEIILAELRGIGLPESDIQVQEFQVAVPMVQSAELESAAPPSPPGPPPPPPPRRSACIRSGRTWRG